MFCSQLKFILILGFSWSLHKTLTTHRCLSGVEDVLGSLYLIGNFQAEKASPDQSTSDVYDPMKKKWNQIRDADLSDNGGCTIKVSPTDVIVISSYFNPGRLPLMYRINLADNSSQLLASPPITVSILVMYGTRCPTNE